MTEAAASGPSGGRVAGLSLRGPARLLSDERLSRRAATGDQSAFEEIFRRYHQDLYRFCLATVSNPQDAQEALQNTMVKVVRALPGEEREIKLKPWLFRIARNEAIETLRKRRDTVELGSTQIAAPWEIGDATGTRARLRELFTDLTELPERQRSALIMRELAGLEFEEIGDAFGTSPAVARQTLYEARQSLRQMDEGREMSCADIRQAISDADGRVTRRRDIRAHLRDCVGCRAFRDDIGRRREDLAAIAPLPAAVSLGLLQGALGGEAVGATLAGGAAAGGGATAAGSGAAAGGGGLASTIGVGAGQAVATSAIVKSAATVAVVAAVGVGAADRGGLIDLPSPRNDGKPAQRATPSVAPATEAPPGVPSQGETGAKGAGRSDVSSPGSGGVGEGTGAGQPAKAARRPGSKHAAGKPDRGAAAHGRPDHAKAPAAPAAKPPAVAKPPGKPDVTGRGAPAAPPVERPEAPTSEEPSVPAAPKPTLPPSASKPKAESSPPATPAPEEAPSAPPATGKGSAKGSATDGNGLGANAEPLEEATP